MLDDYIQRLIAAYADKDEALIEEIHRDLEKIGMDRLTAQTVVLHMLPEYLEAQELL